MRHTHTTTRTGQVLKGLLPAIPLILAGAFLAGPAEAAPPRTVNVNCDAGKTITGALENTDLGRPLVIVVRGDCVEDVVIARDDVTLIAASGSNATIAATAPTTRAINIRGQRVRVEGFDAVIGGLDGILVRRGASAEIVGNTIRDSVGNDATRNGTGVSVSQSSYALIQGNTIRDNRRNGINVLESSITDIFDNQIIDNGGFGIVVLRTAAADIDGNTVTGNGSVFNRDGIGVFWNSHARLSNRGNANLIEGNALNGVRCSSNSSIRFMIGQNFGGGNTGGNTSFAPNCAVTFIP